MAGNRKVSYGIENEKEETVASQTEIKTDRRKDVSAFKKTEKISAEQVSSQVNNQLCCSNDIEGQNHFKLYLNDKDQKGILLNKLQQDARFVFDKSQISIAIGDPSCPTSERDDLSDSSEKNSTNNNINSFQIELQQSNLVIKTANLRKQKEQMHQYPQIFSYQESSEQKSQYYSPEETKEPYDENAERYSERQKQERIAQENRQIQEATSPSSEQNSKELNVPSKGSNNYHGIKQIRHSSFNKHTQEISQFPKFHPKLSFQMASSNNNNKELANFGNQNSQVSISPVKKMSTSISRKYSTNNPNNSIKINCTSGSQTNPSNRHKISEQFSKKRHMYFGEDKSSGNGSPTFLYGSESNIKQQNSNREFILF